MADRIVQIVTKLSPEQITRAIHQTLQNAFNRPTSQDHVTVASHIAYEVFKENLSDFVPKSQSTTDRWGQRWKPLAPSTIRRKLGKAAKSLSRSKDVAERGLASVIRSGLRRGVAGLSGLVPINIDTGRLIRSLTPYNGSRSNYAPPPDQVATVRNQELKLGTKVKYARHVQAVRPILPPADKVAPWVATGLADGLQEICSRVG